MSEVINLTPHDVVLMTESGDVRRVFPASGDVARLATIELGTNYIDGVPVEFVEFGHLTKHFPKKENVWYIVSLPTTLACPNRSDFLVPYLEVRDDSGRIIGCRLLARSV